ncbi:helix-turn-helix domain-containing protein [Yinghuangia sp. ASG 101]|uniref:helix-turn-helix domain-containing protein n=1 Tax=Yinghuangia sp. ASG 101 TaxID=2896848 RepID=UPI001E48E210|nr:helix-turn-helix transcriptional regulator [Yinghuangia sp. ASG 101]UGQ09511.1 helix-turn-helix domain-containing protein [Yinghuangia sp. ASG 101]
MSDAIPPTSDELSFGQRLKVLRLRRGMTREVLAGLVGMSPAWVKSVESNHIGMPKLSKLMRIAEALRIRDLSQLTGGQSIRVEQFSGPGHARLPEVRAALNAFTVLPDREAAAPADLRARLARAWAARHASPYHRDVVGELLPSLIADAQLAVRQAESPSSRHAAQALLSEVYSLAQFFVAYQPVADLLWRVSERGMMAAQESGDPHAIGVASWLAAQAHRDAGDWEAADAVNLGAATYLEPLVPDAPVEVHAIWGALLFEAAYTAAQRGEAGVAWGYWDKANAVAQRLPSSYYHPVTSFSRAIMSAHAVTVAVELHQGGESVRQAQGAEASVIPSRPRRARHRIEQARAFYLDRQPEVAVATIDSAYEAAPETVAYNSYARRILLEELDVRNAPRRERAAVTAEKIGLLAS